MTSSATACVCGHPRHHHADARYCHTVTVTGPASPEIHMGGTHPDRNLVRCGCLTYSPGTGDQVQTQHSKEVTE